MSDERGPQVPDGPGDIEAELDRVRDTVAADPALADDVRSVLRHLAATPIDPTGAPE